MAKKQAAAAAIAEAPIVEAEPAPKAETPTKANPSVKLDLSKYETRMPELSKKLRYWVGVTDQCPRKPVHLAGQDFPFTVTPPRDSGDGTMVRDTKFGQIVSLTDEQVEKIKEAAAMKVIHWNNTRTKGFVLDKRNVGFIFDPADEPLAKYVYMVRVEELMPSDFRQRPSKDTMVE